MHTYSEEATPKPYRNKAIAEEKVQCMYAYNDLDEKLELHRNPSQSFVNTTNTY